jgi:hypothetical protein
MERVAANGKIHLTVYKTVVKNSANLPEVQSIFQGHHSAPIVPAAAKRPAFLSVRHLPFAAVCRLIGMVITHLLDQLRIPTTSRRRWNQTANSARIPTPYYVWRVVFSHHEIPKLRMTHWLPEFTHTNREIWVKQRQIKDLLLAIEPGARVEKHEARRCPICHRWFLGIAAQMLREREVVARMNGKTLEPCGEFCRPPAERRRRLKLALSQSTAI